MAHILAMPFPRNNALLVGVRPSRPPTSFVPTDIANLALWVKADAGLFKDAAKAQPANADGDAVYTWADQSGSGNDLVQATLAKRPLLKLNQQNGLSALLTDGVDDFMATGAFALNQPATVYLVFKWVAWNAAGNIISAADASYARTMQGRTASPQAAMYSGAFGPQAALAAVGSFGIITAIFNGASSTLSLNGGADATGNVGAADGSGFAICHSTDSVLANGQYGEILVYGGAHNATQQGQVRTYLNGRFAVY